MTNQDLAAYCTASCVSKLLNSAVQDFTRPYSARRTHQTAGLVVMKVYAEARVLALHARVHEEARELGAEVDVVRAPSPLPVCSLRGERKRRLFV